MKGVEYKGLESVEGPIVVVRRSENVSFGEMVSIRDRFGEKRIGRIIDLSSEYAVVQVFGSTTGIDQQESQIEFLETPMELAVGRGLLGRVFNGLGKPIDGCPDIVSSRKLNVNGSPINPYARVYPEDFIQTGVSSIDGMNTLIRGQKLPIFSGNGLPHNRLAAQIVRQARLLNTDDEFVIVFAGMGIKHDIAHFFVKSFVYCLNHMYFSHNAYLSLIRLRKSSLSGRGLFLPNSIASFISFSISFRISSISLAVRVPFSIRRSL